MYVYIHIYINICKYTYMYVIHKNCAKSCFRFFANFKKI